VLGVVDALDSTVSILLGNGDGTFQPQVTYAVGSLAVGSNLTAIVAGDFRGDGHLALAVTNAADDTVSVLLGNGDGTFQPQVTYTVGSAPLSIVAGDFTGNGRTDLAVANSQGNLSILLGNGDGTFQPQVIYAAGTNSNAIVAGDFNGDGRLDLAVSDGGDYLGNGSVVSVLLGNGDGTFQRQPETANAVGSAPSFIVAGDFTGNGRTDLAVSNFYGNTVSILLGNGDGTFEPQVSYPVGAHPAAIVAGDFNGDGRLDLAVIDGGDDQGNGSGVSVLPGNGDGTFQPQVTYAVGLPTLSLVAGDFNGDGKLDLAVADSVPPTFASEVSVFLGNGDGTFQPRVTYPAGSFRALSLVAGDFTGSGRTDFAVGNYGFPGPGSVSVLRGNGDGTFQPPVEIQYAVGTYPTAIVAGDFNGDGKLDLATTTSSYPTGTVSVLLGNGDGTFQPAVQFSLGYSPSAIVAGDFNGDGRLDLAVAGSTYNPATFTSTGEFSVLLGNGDGTFQPPLSYTAGHFSRAIVVGGFTGNNGRLDLAVADATDDSVSILLGNGDGTFSDAGKVAISAHSSPVAADVNGDGTPDVLVLDPGGDILYRQGIPGQPGSFEPPIAINPGAPSRDIAWLPSTDQGPVLASVDARDNAVTFFGWRNGAFVRLGSVSTGRLPAQIIAADLNGDGLTDLVVRNAADGTLSVFFGGRFSRGNFIGPLNPQFVPPSFLPPLTLPVGIGVSDVQAIDTTGSGRLDLVVTNKVSGQVSILRYQGNGTFAPPQPYRAGTGLSAIDTSSGSSQVTSLEATDGVVAGPLTPGAPMSLVTANPGLNTLGVLSRPAEELQRLRILG
jgi:hypothetical protein